MNKIIAERYELIDIIGQGGMADVYLANDTILNRTIAIKILRTSLAKDPIYIARFQREASAAAALSIKILLKFMMLVKIVINTILSWNMYLVEH